MGSTNAPVFPDPSAPARSGPFPAKTKAGAELRVRGRVHRTMPSGIAVPWSAWGGWRRTPPPAQRTSTPGTPTAPASRPRRPPREVYDRVWVTTGAEDGAGRLDGHVRSSAMKRIHSGSVQLDWAGSAMGSAHWPSP